MLGCDYASELRGFFAILIVAVLPWKGEVESTGEGRILEGMTSWRMLGAASICKVVVGQG